MCLAERRADIKQVWLACAVSQASIHLVIYFMQQVAQSASLPCVIRARES